MNLTVCSRVRANSFGGFRPAHQIAGIENVLFDGAPGVLWLSFPYRCINLAVEDQRPLQSDAIGKMAHAHQHCAMNTLEEQVVDAATDVGFARNFRTVRQEDTAGEVSGRDGSDRAVGEVGVGKYIYPLSGS